jgi:hypothetical protein
VLSKATIFAGLLFEAKYGQEKQAIQRKKLPIGGSTGYLNTGGHLISIFFPDWSKQSHVTRKSLLIGGAGKACAVLL